MVNVATVQVLVSPFPHFAGRYLTAHCRGGITHLLPVQSYTLLVVTYEKGTLSSSFLHEHTTLHFSFSMKISLFVQKP